MAAHIRADTGGEALPGAIVSIQTAGNFRNGHPHLHGLATAGSFTVDGKKRDTTAETFYRRILGRTGLPQKAIVAVARKLAIRLWRLSAYPAAA